MRGQVMSAPGERRDWSDVAAVHLADPSLGALVEGDRRGNRRLGGGERPLWRPEAQGAHGTAGTAGRRCITLRESTQVQGWLTRASTGTKKQPPRRQGHDTGPAPAARQAVSVHRSTLRQVLGSDHAWILEEEIKGALSYAEHLGRPTAAALAA